MKYKSDPNNQSTKENPVGRFMVAVGAIIELRDTGKILIIKRSADLDWQAGEWETLYGRLDQFETPELGLAREVKEEIGLDDLEIKKVLSVWHIYRGEKKSAENELVGITFWATSQTNEVFLSKEHSEYRWVEPDEALKLVNIEGIKKDINKFVEAKKTNSN